MILSSSDIKNYLATGEISITPFIEENLKPGSYTFTLGSKLCQLKIKEFLDSADDTLEFENAFEMTKAGYLLEPGDFIIGFIAENVMLGRTVSLLLTTRGSKGQIDLDALHSDQFAEPGSSGFLALPIHNIGPLPILLRPGIKLVKGIFFPVSSVPNVKNSDKEFTSRYLAGK